MNKTIGIFIDKMVEEYDLLGCMIKDNIYRNDNNIIELYFVSGIGEGFSGEEKIEDIIIKYSIISESDYYRNMEVDEESQQIYGNGIILYDIDNIMLDIKSRAVEYLEDYKFD